MKFIETWKGQEIDITVENAFKYTIENVSYESGVIEQVETKLDTLTEKIGKLIEILFEKATLDKADLKQLLDIRLEIVEETSFVNTDIPRPRIFKP